MGAQAFESIVGRIDYPMYIVTALVGDERDGCLVGFTTQCSIDPPRFLVCMSDKNRTTRMLEAGGGDAMVVHLVPEEAGHIVELFGGETGDEVDKFELCDWVDGPWDIPVLAGVPGWFGGSVLDRFDLGDHVGLWLDVVVAEDRGGPVNLGFQAVKPIEPGHPA